jgi:undecaprenyl diphosphate synthase
MSTPKHIAIIMDGNGRWARNKGRLRVYGHQVGKKAVTRVVQYCLDYGIESLTLFAMSTENFSRSKFEVDFIIDLLTSSIVAELNELNNKNIKISFVGDDTILPEKLRDTITEASKATSNNTALNLTIALNYSGRWHITKAVNNILDHRQDSKYAENITEDEITKMINNDLISEPDLLIRTGGECRISNFLLWSLAYTELFFTQTYWPDFEKKDFEEALNSYKDRNRRYGLITEEKV